MKIKSLLSYLLTLSLLLSMLVGGSVIVSADTENGFIFTLSADGATVTGLESGYNTTSLTVPDTLGGKPVVTIGQRAFLQCRTAKITLPDSVTTIEASAFSYSEVEEITLPAQLTYIGDSAFYQCEALTGVVIPDSVTAIKKNAFAYCKALKTANLPASLTSLGISVFTGCERLASPIVIPEGITEIPESSFFNCQKIPSVTFHDGVTAVGNTAFQNCDSITSLVLPMALTELSYNCFASCDSLTELTLGDKTTGGLLAHPFEKCNIKTLYIAEGSTIASPDVGDIGGIETLVIPNTVTEIGENAFIGYGALKTVVIPDSVTKIGAAAFKNCENLEEFTIPDSVTEIGENAFESTGYALIAANWTDGVLYNGNYLLDVDDKYEGELAVQDGTLVIATGAFSLCSGVTLLRLPASLQNINDETFTSSNYNLDAVEFDGNQDEWKKVTVGKHNETITDQKIIYKTGGSYGDVNIDGKVNAADALEVLKNAVGKTEFDLRALTVANVDLSNKIDAADALMILKKAVDKLDSFPAEK